MTPTIALLEAGRQLSRWPCIWLQRLETRKHLAALTHRQLRDIGLDPEIVAREAQKPFWRPLGAMVGDAAPRSAPVKRQVPPALRPASTFSAVLLPWRS
jgi:uncharacterized protein YjiS (DUF1127 family)